MTLFDVFLESIAGPWKSGPMDTQWKVSDTEEGRMLSFMGTDISWHGGRIDGSIEDLKADALNLIPNPFDGWRPLGISRLRRAVAEILLECGPIDYAAGWSLGGMLAREAMPSSCITFGAPRTRVLWHRRDVGSLDVLLRTDGLARGFYPGYKRASAILYIGKRGALDVRDHSIAAYMAAIAEIVA